MRSVGVLKLKVHATKRPIVKDHFEMLPATAPVPGDNRGPLHLVLAI